ncbi:5-methylcytosine-specific restriction endonuclease McrA [Shinella sp. BE166]|uniref:HNH endonuclease n=1 Tax=Shinella sp. BE166 TaxID=3373918 RepID=UPI003EC03E4D
MSRAIPEWTGKHDDAAIPGDVKLRIWNRAKGFCEICTRKILAGEPKHFDHIKPLADGGRHAEKNLQIACVACHADKTAAEATERAKVKAVAKSVLGLKASPAKPLRGAAFPKSSKPERRDPNKGLPELPRRKLYEERA